MLVADECHHYIEAPVFQRIRDYKYNAVLALSATVGSDNYWIKGFNRVLQTYSLAKAITDGAVAKPLIRNVHCKLNAEEAPRHEKYSKKISEYRQVVEGEFKYELRGQTGNDYWRTLVALDSRVDGGIPEIRRLFTAIYKRSSLVYQAREKEVAAQRIIRKLLKKGRKVIVFFERIDSIHRAEGMSQGRIEKFEDSIKRAAKEEVAFHGSLHSDMDQNFRDKVLADFAENECGVLFCCRMVDEGYDLPDIDAAIIVASSQSERQRIQRAGRVLRRGDGDKQALIVTLYCEGTSDAYIVKNDRKLFSTKSDIKRLSTTELVKEI
jgi:superfamily II DNA or RNA helicase